MDGGLTLFENSPKIIPENNQVDSLRGDVLFGWWETAVGSRPTGALLVAVDDEAPNWIVNNLGRAWERTLWLVHH
jgi:hypothetical protein